MKRRNLLTAIAAIVMIFALAACSESVALEDRLGTITFGENSSRAVGTVVKYSNEVEDMIWFYEATKLDDGYTTGKTDGFEAVAEATKKSGDNNTTTYEATAGLSGQTLNNNFSYGLWEIVLEGYKKGNVEVSSEGKVTIKTNASAEYTATISNFLVDKGANYATAQIQLGDNPTTEIVFDAVEGISFESANITADSKFTLAVTDTKGTVAVETSDGVNDVNVEKGKVTFYDLTYTPETGVDISGEHTMNFVLSQTLSGTGNTTIEAALYTLKFTVQKGTTTTISGTLVKNDVTGTVQINSVQDVPKLTVNRVLEVKDIDSSKSIATITSDRTIKYGDMEVTYPAGAKIATTEDTLSVDEGENTGTSDAEIGLEYVDSSMPTDEDNKTVTISGANSSEKYKLTLSASTADTGETKNTVLLTIKKNIGAKREISAVYHEKASLAEYGALTDDAKKTTESYEYDNTSGVLTLRLFHASNIFIVTKEYVAEANGVRYYSLSDAITASSSAGGTVTLIQDITLAENEIKFDKSITIDLNGNTINFSNSKKSVAIFLLEESKTAYTVTFKNGNIKGTGKSKTGNTNIFWVEKNGTLKVDDVDIEATIDTAIYLCKGANPSNLELTNSNIKTTGIYGISTNAGENGASTNITVKNSTIEVTLNDENDQSYHQESTGMMVNINAKVSVENSTISGQKQGMIIRSTGTETVSIKNTTISSTGTKGYKPGDADGFTDRRSEWKSGNEVPLAALVIGNNYGPNKTLGYKRATNVSLENVTLLTPNESEDRVKLHVHQANTEYKVSVKGTIGGVSTDYYTETEEAGNPTGFINESNGGATVEISIKNSSKENTCWWVDSETKNTNMETYGDNGCMHVIGSTEEIVD